MDVIAVTSSDNAPPILIGFDIPCIVIVFPEGAKFTFADAVRFPVTVVFPVMFPMRLEVTENAVRFPVTVVFPVMFPMRFEVTENPVRFPVTFPVRFENVLGAYNAPYVYKLEPEIDPITVKLPIKVLDVNKPC